MIWSLSPKGKAVSLPHAEDKKTGGSPRFCCGQASARRHSAFGAPVPAADPCADNCATERRDCPAAFEEACDAVLGVMTLRPTTSVKLTRIDAARGRGRESRRRVCRARRMLADRV